MSKFCGNCGAQLEDSANVCGYCGTVIEQAAITGKTDSLSGVVSETDAKKIAKTKKYVKLGVIAAAVIAIIVIGINIISSFTGYKGAIRAFVKAFEECDVNTMAEYSSVLHYGGDEDDYEELIEELEDRTNYILDDYEEELGHDLKFDYEICDVYDISNRKREDLLEKLDYYEIYVDIDEIKSVELLLTIEGSRRSTTEEFDIVLLKEDGDWKILYNLYDLI